MACTTLDGQPIAVTGGYNDAGGTLRIWDLTTGTMIDNVAVSARISDLAVHRDLVIVVFGQDLLVLQLGGQEPSR